jgi:hypothetical protein
VLGLRIRRTRQRAHSRQRARERYNLELVDRVRKEILRTIQANDGRAVFIRRGWSKRYSIFDVPVAEMNGALVRVVYDKKLKSLATVLPREEA